MIELDGFNSYRLKWVAVIVIVIDHATNLLYGHIPNDFYWDLHRLGRIAFPLFAFMIVEGLYYTKNRKKYLLSMGIVGLLSELPYDLFFFGVSHFDKGVNVFGTLFLGLSGIMISEKIIEKIKDRKVAEVLSIIVFIPLYLIGNKIKVDYNGLGVALIFVIYEFEKLSKLKIFDNVENRQLLKNILASVSIVLWTYAYDLIKFETRQMWMEVFGIAAILFILLYNGKRGEYKVSKWFFYVFYPLHLFILYGIGQCLI